jgi:hypothetical protein
MILVTKDDLFKIIKAINIFQILSGHYLLIDSLGTFYGPHPNNVTHMALPTQSL